VGDAGREEDGRARVGRAELEVGAVKEAVVVGVEARDAGAVGEALAALREGILEAVWDSVAVGVWVEGVVLDAAWHEVRVPRGGANVVVVAQLGAGAD